MSSGAGILKYVTPARFKWIGSDAATRLTGSEQTAERNVVAAMLYNSNILKYACMFVACHLIAGGAGCDSRSPEPPASHLAPPGGASPLGELLPSATVDESAQDAHANAVGGEIEIVRCSEEVTNTFHEYWNGLDFIFNEATSRQLDDLSIELRKWMAKYPTGLLDGRVRRIVVCSEILLNGKSIAGTYAGSTIAITCITDRQSTDYVERVFHAEVSSCLLNRHPELFRRLQWLGFNPEGFEYWGWSGFDDDSMNNTGVNWRTAKDGFYSSYAKTDVENDFNEIASALWSGDWALWSGEKVYPRIRGKINVAIGFYKELNPECDEAFFRALCNER
jgi:hypothetical protein